MTLQTEHQDANRRTTTRAPNEAAPREHRVPHGEEQARRPLSNV